MFFFLKKAPDDETGDCSPFSHLPDEIVLQILSKLIGLRTLCICKLVSKRFNQIVNQVDTICLTEHPLDRPNVNSNTSDPTLPKTLFQSWINVITFKSVNVIRSTFAALKLPGSPPDFVRLYQLGTFLSAIKSLKNFKKLKSLRIEVPSSLKGVDNRCLFKWKINFVNRIDSFVFLSPNSVCDTNGVYANENLYDDEVEDLELTRKKCNIGMDCLEDAILRRWMLLDYITKFPLLENVSVNDTNKRGRVSVSGEKILELRNWLSSLTETTPNRLDRPRLSMCYVPLLELPVSGYVMKGAFLYVVERDDLADDNYESFLDIDWNDSEDKEESIYNEAMMEIFTKHRGRIHRL